ncbi:MAG: hypothetical protein CM15mP74_18300 [Halieaceae bacterium]|nr:MAG: hypothetical protein CM15mP74_18300 [Halieaceae bacterium]
MAEHVLGLPKKGVGMSVLGNVSIRLTEEQGMLLMWPEALSGIRHRLRRCALSWRPIPATTQPFGRQWLTMGWAGIALPDTVGGAGMGVGSAVPVFEALGGGLLGTPLLSTTLAGQLIWRAAGSQPQSGWGACVPGRWGRSPISTMPTGAQPIWAWSWVPTGRSRGAKASSRMPAWPTVLRSWPVRAASQYWLW